MKPPSRAPPRGIPTARRARQWAGAPSWMTATPCTALHSMSRRWNDGLRCGDSPSMSSRSERVSLRTRRGRHLTHELIEKVESFVERLHAQLLVAAVRVAFAGLHEESAHPVRWNPSGA